MYSNEKAHFFQVGFFVYCTKSARISSGATRTSMATGHLRQIWLFRTTQKNNPRKGDCFFGKSSKVSKSPQW
jgi:hypothetical protein